MNSSPSPFTIVLRLFLKWWWLIAIAVAIGGGVGYFVRSKQPNVYVAKTTVLFGQFFQTGTQRLTGEEIQVEEDFVDDEGYDISEFDDEDDDFLYDDDDDFDDDDDDDDDDFYEDDDDY